MGTNATLNTTDECSFALLWSELTVSYYQPILYVVIVAAFSHALFWLQVLLSSSVRQRALQWIYAYLVTDILLIARFFFLYIVHTVSTTCHPNEMWYMFVCYFEVTVDNYLNTLEVYMLLALNLCRYAQIAHNTNVYITRPGLLIIAHLAVCLLPLVLLIIQLQLQWTVLDTRPNASCDLMFRDMFVQLFNIFIAFALPICLNLVVFYASVRHIHIKALLRQGRRHHLSARDKYHRSLAIQFLVFYLIWLALWSPNIIVSQLADASDRLVSIFQLLNYIEIALDPLIIGGLDARFRQVWKNIWKYAKEKWTSRFQWHRARIEPLAAHTSVRAPPVATM